MEGRHEVQPPFSRLYVICGRTATEAKLRAVFSPFGEIEDIYVPKTAETREPKGFAYVKFEKTSSAAKAMEQLVDVRLDDESKPIRIMMATARNPNDVDSRSRTRLFVRLPKTYTEADFRAQFDRFGAIEYLKVVRDRETKESKGVGYVEFVRASEAAAAYENCDQSLRPLFADPKGVAPPSGSRASLGDAGDKGGTPYLSGAPYGNYFPSFSPSPYGVEEGGADEKVRLYVVFDQSMTQRQFSSLFDLVPGMQYCILKTDRATGRSRGFGYVTYASPAAAMYAKEKLNGFEYPPGYRLVVKYAEKDPHAPQQQQQQQQQSPLEYPAPLPGSYHLPYPPVVSPHGVATAMAPTNEYKVFINCSPKPMPLPQLHEIFSQFGSLTNVWLVSGRNFGYATYGRKSAAERAIAALHDMEMNGVKIKVTSVDDDSEESQETQRKRMRSSTEYD